MRLACRATAALAVVVASLTLVGAARAQAPAPYAPAPTVAPAPIPAPAPQAVPPPPPVADPYDDVLRRLLRSGCRDGLAEARLLSARGQTPWAETVSRLCGEILRTQVAAPMYAPPPPPTPSSHERDGRGTLVIASTIYGIWTGIAFDVLFKVNEVRSAILPPLLGMGAGLALSIGLTADHPMTNGQAWSIVTGLEYGSVNGAVWAGAFGFGAEDVIGTTLVTGLAAGAAGVVVAQRSRPTQGDVEVVRSGILWGTATGLLGMAVLAPGGTSSKSFFRGTAVSMDLGFIAGLALASGFDVSRNRALIIDAGTLGGGVAGFGITVLALGTTGTGRSIAGGTLVGMLGGMLLTTYLTRDMDDSDDDDHDARVAALLGRDERGRWRWGTPGPTPVLDGLGHRVVGATFTALGGTF